MRDEEWFRRKKMAVPWCLSRATCLPGHREWNIVSGAVARTAALGVRARKDASCCDSVFQWLE